MTTKPSVLDGATAEHWAMVEANTELVWFFVNRIPMAESSRDDAYQDGLLGLLRASMLFDPDRGFTFSTYASAWIRQYIAKGRGRFEGRSYRRASATGTPWSPPLSLDSPTVDCDEPLGSMVADDAADCADVVAFEVLMDQLDGKCTDDLDRELLALMTAGAIERGGGPGGRGTTKVLADRYGISRQTVVNRRRRLELLARRQFEAAA